MDEFMSLYAAVKKGEVSGLGGTSLLDGLTQNATKFAAGLGFGGEKVNNEDQTEQAEREEKEKEIQMKLRFRNESA